MTFQRRPLAVLMAIVVAACGNTVVPTPTRPADVRPTPTTAGPTAAASPSATGAPAATDAPPSPADLATLPPDIVAAVDRVVGASSDAERSAAVEAMLVSIGVTVSADAGAAAQTPAGIVIAPEELEVIAAEAGRRDVHRATLAEFATTFGGMSLLPPNEALAADLPAGWPEVAAKGVAGSAEVRLSSLPARVASVINDWVATSLSEHGSPEPALVTLTTAPLLLAELSRRRPEPIDLSKPFSAGDVRLGWLEITILVAGMRSMLAGAQATGIASGSTGSPHGIALIADTPCDNLKSMIDSRVPLATTAIGSFVGDQIKGFIQGFVNGLFGEASAFAQGVSRAFKVLGVIFRVQALILLYSESTARMEMAPASYHKPDGANSTARATVVAGIPDPAWQAAQQARQLSPFATALRTCARFIGLPVWQDLVDVGDSMSGWKVQWEVRQGGGHIQIPTRNQFSGSGAGRLERPLNSYERP